MFYTNKRLFNGSLSPNWQANLADFKDICAHWNVPDRDKVLFSRYSLSDISDARKCFDNMMKESKTANQIMAWRQLCEMFSSRYDSFAKQNEISKRLMTLKMEDERDDEGYDYVPHVRPTSRIDQSCLNGKNKGS